MLKRLQGILATTSSDKDNKAIKPNSVTKTLKNTKTNRNNGRNGNSFLGMNRAQIEQNLKGHTEQGVLSSVKLPKDAEKSLKASYIEDCYILPTPMLTNLLEEVSYIYSNGQHTLAIEKLRNHLNENKGNVGKEYWYMLMDIYQSIGERAGFERTASSFSSFFSTSPPSWYVNEQETKPNIFAGKNILIIDKTLNDMEQKFKEFLKASKIEGFSRININQCDFENSNLDGFQKFYNTLLKINKMNISSVLMGENKLLNFCKKIINEETDSINDELVKNSNLFWLLYLEILQWKGEEEEFENIAIEYAEKFNISPPGWESSKVMKIESGNDMVVQDLFSLEKTLTRNNVKVIFDDLESQLSQYSQRELDFSKVEKIEYAGVIEFSQFLQNFYQNEDNKDKEIIIKFPNQMIETIFELTSITEFVNIIPKKR